MVAEDHWTDGDTGELHEYTDRLWLIRRGEKLRPVATWRIDIATATPTDVAALHWRADDLDGGRLFIDDRRGDFHRGCSSSVWLHNTEQRRCIATRDAQQPLCEEALTYALE